MGRPARVRLLATDWWPKVLARGASTLQPSVRTVAPGVRTEPTTPHSVWELTCRRWASRTRPTPLGSSSSTAMATTALWSWPPSGALAPLPAPDAGLVDLDHTVEPVPIGPDDGPAQLVHPCPRRAVRAHPQHPLKTERGDAVVLGGDQPHRREPIRQRQPRSVEDRPRCHRGLAPARPAQPEPRRRLPRLRAPTARATEPVRPAQPRELRGTRLVVRKPARQLGERRRVVHPGHRHPPQRPPPHLVASAVKGIPHFRNSSPVHRT
jgi:hypothetical protein